MLLGWDHISLRSTLNSIAKHLQLALLIFVLECLQGNMVPKATFHISNTKDDTTY